MPNAKNWTVEQMAKFSKSKLNIYILRLHQWYASGNIPKEIGSKENLIRQHARAVDAFRRKGGNKKEVDQLDVMSRKLQRTRKSKAKKLLRSISKFDDVMLVPEAVSVIGSVTDLKEFNDVDFFIKCINFVKDAEKAIKDNLPPSFSKSMHIVEGDTPHGHYFPVYDLVLRRRPFIKKKPDYRTTTLKYYGRHNKVVQGGDKFASLSLSGNAPVIIEALPNERFANVQVHRKDDQVYVFNKNGMRMNLPNLEKKLLEIKEPTEYIVDAYLTKKQIQFTDVLKWKTTELVNLPRAERTTFLQKFSVNSVVSMWAWGKDQIKDAIKQLYADGHRAFVIKGRRTKYDVKNRCVVYITKGGLMDLEQLMEALAAGQEKVTLGQQDFAPLESRGGYGTLSFNKANVDELYNSWAKGYLEDNQPLRVEPKFGGDRVIIHWDGKNFKAFAKKGAESIASRFPKSLAELKEGMKGKSFVIDTVLTENDKRGQPVKREELLEWTNQKSEVKRSEEGLRFNIIDAMLYNGEDIHNMSLKDRLATRDEILPGDLIHWRRVDGVFAKNKNELLNAIRKQTDKRREGSEGAMIKVWDGTESRYFLDGDTIGWGEYIDLAK